MIARHSIEEVLNTARIEDIVGDYVNLRKRGSTLLGLCPFHSEKTPSFTVSPSRNIFKCFGCGKGGDAAHFLMEHENMTWPEAIRHIAARYRIELEETRNSAEAEVQAQEQESLFIVNQFALELFSANLWNSEEGQISGLAYLKERGFLDDTIRKFGLGYALAKGDDLTLRAFQKGHSVDYLRRLGLMTQHNKDFFRKRVIFPIHNPSGKVVAFAGRTIGKDEHGPKYLNSPETEIYKKSQVLYGLYFARQAIKKQDRCFLVEGYTDVISLHQGGIENVVASSGTALTQEQVRLIRRFTENITILYDGDPAGIKAALRGIDMILEENMNVRIVLLPENEDPDSFLRNQGASQFIQYVDTHQQDFILFKTSLLVQEAANDPVKKAALIRSVVDSMARIPDPIKRAVYARECSLQLGVQEEILIRETNQLVFKQIKEKRKPEGIRETSEDPELLAREFVPDTASRQRSAPHSSHYQEQDLVRILITGGDQLYDPANGTRINAFVIENIREVLDGFENPLFQRIIHLVRDVVDTGMSLSYHDFLHHDDPEIRQLALSFSGLEEDFSPNWMEKWQISLNSQKMPHLNFDEDSVQAILRFKLKKLIQLCKENQEKLAESLKQGNQEEYFQFLKVQDYLIKSRNELAARLGTVVLW